MTMMTIPHFKEIPCLDYYSATDSDDDKLGAHYKLSFPRCIMGEVIENKDFDDGTQDCEGTDDNKFTLSEHPDEDTMGKYYENRRPDWDKVNTIHFHESCTVPRYKLGSFCSKRNIKVTRSAEKADLILYGPNFSDGLVRSNGNYFLKKSDFLKKASQLKRMKVPQEMIDSITNHESDLVMLDREMDHFVPKKDQIYGEYLQLEDTEVTTWNSLTQDHKYCNQDILLEDMGLEIMDEYTFRRVCQMFESEDDENHRVAMEIMANCNYGKSIVYLLELMRRYYGEKMFNTNDRSHVSFKALRVYLHYEPRNTTRTLNEIISNVADRNLLTEANYKILLNLILEEEEKRMGAEDDDYDNDNWRILQVDLSPKYKAMVIWDKKEEEVPVLEESQPDFTA